MKKTLFLIIGLLLSTLLANDAEARILFKNEFLIQEDGSEAFILDAGDDVSGDLILQFGASLAETIHFDSTNAWFEFSDDVTIFGSALVEHIGTGQSFRVNDEASDTTPFIIDDAGLVGVGTATPAALVDVIGPGAGGDGLHVQAGEVDGADFIVHFEDADTTVQAFFIDASGDIGINNVTPTTWLDIERVAEVIELGDTSASDIFLNFDDGTDRNFGWDDSEGSLSTFDEQLRFRTRQSATPPVACTAAVAGMQWMDTDNGITYSCDTSNGRNKWLSIGEMVIFGDESGTCPAGSDVNSNTSCNVDWGNGLGPDGSTDLGFYIPQEITVTGYGFSEDNDACTSGSFDVEIWSTGSNSNDNAYSFEADLATGLTGQAHNSNTLNVDIAGDQYTAWGIDNNCGEGIDDWNVVIYFRYRHD